MFKAISIVPLLASLLGVLAYVNESERPAAPTTAVPQVTSPASLADDEPLIVELGTEVFVIDEYNFADYQIAVLEDSAPHVFTIGCGGFKEFGCGPTSAHGTGNTPGEAAGAALAALAKKLWPSVTHTCAQCPNPGKCLKAIAYPSDSPPKVDVGPGVAYPYEANASYSGAYAAFCTSCE